MSSEEEKGTAGHEPAGNEVPEPELTDLGSSAQAAEPGGADLMPGENDPRDKKEKKFWLISLAVTLFVLAGVGFFAMTGMRQAAHKLGGGSDYDQLSANSSIYDGGAGAAKNKDYFPLDEEAARKEAVYGANSGRLNSALVRSQEELVAAANGESRAPEAGGQDEGEKAAAAAGSAAPGRAGGTAMAARLSVKAGFGGGARGSGAKSLSAGSAEAFAGSGSAVGKASYQRETKQGLPRQAGKGSVMQALKGAFKATFYGARLSSQDSAKSWIAKSFDGTTEAETAIEYDDKMRSKLDKVNPDGIPNFLKDLDVSADDAKRLTTSDVGKPRLDKDGTKSALDEDKKYQAQKLAQDFSGSMINGIFGGISGAGAPDSGGGGLEGAGPDGGGPPGATVFSDPNSDPDLYSITQDEVVDTYGNGEECGCTAAAPCCCLPQNSAGGAGISDGGTLWAGPDSGDFPSVGDTMLV